MHELVEQSSPAASLGLKIQENYTSLPGFPLLTTRIGENAKKQTTYSQIDYVLSNRSTLISTDHDNDIFDYIIFNTKLTLKNTKIQKKRTTKRNQILRELSLLPIQGVDDTL